MTDLFNDCRFLVITGNYGSGKTEISLNLAFEAARNRNTTLVDLDIVNPYFRTGEKAEELREAGIRVLMPTYAMTTVDIPALPAEIQSVFEVPSDRVIFDVGGDDTGAAALGRYYPSFTQHRQELMTAFVINCARPLTMCVDDILDLARRIENRGRLPIDILINNTNLADETTPQLVMEGENTVLECADRMGISRVITSGKQNVLEQCTLRTPKMKVSRYMAPEWMVDTP
jgi:hypothetical protein